MGRRNDTDTVAPFTVAPLTAKAARILPVVLTAMLLSSCGAMYGDVCPDVAPSASDAQQPRNCTDGFFSAKNQRSVLYGGNDVPRLYTGEAPRQGGLVDTSRVNTGPRNSTPFVGYVGSLRVEYAADVNTIDTDIENIRSAGARRFDPNQQITVEFNKATVDFVLRQLLGGALGVTYVAPEDRAAPSHSAPKRRSRKARCCMWFATFWRATIW